MLSLRWRLELRRGLILAAKFGGAAAASLALSRVLAPLDLLSGAFVALLTLQPTLSRGLRSSAAQLLGTTVATAITVATVATLGIDPAGGVSLTEVAIAAAAVGVLGVRLATPEVTAVALFTVLYLSLMPVVLRESFWGMLHLRYLTILTGIASSTVINLLASRLRHQDRLHLELLTLMRRLAGLSTALAAELEADGAAPVPAPGSALGSAPGSALGSAPGSAPGGKLGARELREKLRVWRGDCERLAQDQADVTAEGARRGPTALANQRRAELLVRLERHGELLRSLLERTLTDRPAASPAGAPGASLPPFGVGLPRLLRRLADEQRRLAEALARGESDGTASSPRPHAPKATGQRLALERLASRVAVARLARETRAASRAVADYLAARPVPAQSGTVRTGDRTEET